MNEKYTQEQMFGSTNYEIVDCISKYNTYKLEGYSAKDTFTRIPTKEEFYSFSKLDKNSYSDAYFDSLVTFPERNNISGYYMYLVQAKIRQDNEFVNKVSFSCIPFSVSIVAARYGNRLQYWGIGVVVPKSTFNGNRTMFDNNTIGKIGQMTLGLSSNKYFLPLIYGSLQETNDYQISCFNNDYTAEPVIVGYLKLNGQKIPFARVDDPNLVLIGFTTAIKTKGEIYSLLPATTGIAVKHGGETKRFKIN